MQRCGVGEMGPQEGGRAWLLHVMVTACARFMAKICRFYFVEFLGLLDRYIFILWTFKEVLYKIVKMTSRTIRSLIVRHYFSTINEYFKLTLYCKIKFSTCILQCFEPIFSYIAVFHYCCLPTVWFFTDKKCSDEAVMAW